MAPIPAYPWAGRPSRMDNFPLPAGAVPGRSIPAPQRLTVPTMGSNNTVQRFRPRVTVEAIRYDGTNDVAIAEWTGCDLTRSTGPDGELYITLPGGRGMRVNVGEWIISGTTGMYFTRAPEQFAKDYLPEPAEPELTPEQQVGAAQLRVIAAERAAAQAQADLENARRAASRLAVEVRQGLDRVTQMNRAAQLESFDSFTEAVDKLSPNAQRMVNAFRGDQA